MVTATIKLKDAYSLEEAMTNLDSILKSRDVTLPTKFNLVNGMVSPAVMWELGCKESWVPKNWCFWTMVLEKTLESPLDCKEIQPVHPKQNQSWIFIGRTDPEAETQILWPPDAIWKKINSFEKTLMLGRLKAGGKGDDRWRDGWMASPTESTWVWVNSGSWWWTGRPDTLQSMWSQSQTRLTNWTDWLS